MKKIIISAICIIIIGLSVWGYIEMRKDSVSAKRDLYESVPGEPCAILGLSSIKIFQESLLYNNNYWLNMTVLNTVNKTHRIIYALDSLKETEPQINNIISSRPVAIAFYASPDGGLRSMLTTVLSKSDWEEAEKFINTYISAEYHTTYYNEFFIASSSEELIEDAKHCIDAHHSPIMDDNVFRKIRLSSGDKQEANIFINGKRCRNVLKNILLDEMNRVFDVSDQYDDWCGYDIDFSEDRIEINGFAYSNGKSGVVQAFTGQNTNQNTLSEAMPYNTWFFRHFAITNLEDYRVVMFPNAYDVEDELETTSGESPITFFQEYFGGEIAFGRSPLDNFVIVKLWNSDDAQTALRRITLELNPSGTSKNNGIEVFNLGVNGFAGNVFGDYFTLPDEYMCIAGGNLIIAPTASFASYIATRNHKTQTLKCSPVFRSADRTLLSTSNRSVYIDIPYIVRNTHKFFKSDFADRITENKDLWTSFDCIGLQSENENANMDYQHFFIQYSGKPGDVVAEYTPVDFTPDSTETAPSVTTAEPETIDKSETLAETESKEAEPQQSVSEAEGLGKIFSVTLDAPAVIKPQIFTNHYTGENEIFIQDSKNQVYLISAKGKILWKVSVKEPIIGGIKAVDMLKNRKLQIAFLTKSKLYILDRNGKLLYGFPKDIKGEVCTPLSVFDYDNNKDYRFAYGTKDNVIHITKKDGTVLPEWKNAKSLSNIDGEIKHIRLNNKDFITFGDASKIYFLDRKGKSRMSCGDGLVKSAGNDIYKDISELKFVTSLSNGKICFISTNDNETSTLLKKYGNNHRFMREGELYLFCNSSGFDVYNRDLTLIFSDSHINASAMDASGNVWGVYNSHSKSIAVYVHGKDGSVSKSVIDSEGSAVSDLFTVSTLKPLDGKAVVICTGNTIEVYTLPVK
ncbi:MAG: hypothetical protein MJ010_07145 [Paludibacteraceae bacterium]|nr:hypothetical protein [Paludibacteraceae bacterium]